ncbi:unnamed protein product [Cochlearia groenlandica]
MDYIANAIDSKLNSNNINIAATAEETAAIASQSPPKETETEFEISEKAEAQRLCEQMCSKGLRRYVSTNIIVDLSKLMKELPLALKHAKEPAKFVLECIGKFYLQGRKAFSRDSPMIPARNVSLVIMECYLLTLDPGEENKKKLKSSVKKEGETAALAWRKRLNLEGGFAAAEAMDARGLLLLIACFGVPHNFRNMDLLDLIHRSRSAEISVALRRSPFLVPMISGIVESGIKRGMHIEALELVYTFGVEDKFSASTVLTAFLRMKKESFERAKRKAHSPIAFKEANEKQLSALSSVMKSLEAHKLDPAKEVPGWQIKEQMVKLEKDILQLDKEMKEKARSIGLMEEEKARSISLMEEAELAKRLYNQQMKRPRLSAMEMPLPAAASSSSSYYPIYHDRAFPSHREEDRDEISALVSSYLGPSSAFPHRSSIGRSPEYMVPPGGLGRNLSAYEQHLLPSTYSPVHGGRPPRLYSPPTHGQQQIPMGLQRVYRHSPSVERYLGLPNHRSPHDSSSLDHIGGM